MAWEKENIHYYTAGVCKSDFSTPYIPSKRECIQSLTLGVHKIEINTTKMAWEKEYIKPYTRVVCNI